MTKPEAPWVRLRAGDPAALPTPPQPTRQEAEILELRRHYQRLLEAMLPQYHRQPVAVRASASEGTIEPWAQAAFFNFTGVATLPASISLDGVTYQLSASSGPVIKLPCRGCRGWSVEWGAETPVQFSIIFTSDIRDEVSGL